jgi:hypothetical protein
MIRKIKSYIPDVFIVAIVAMILLAYIFLALVANTAR